MKAPDFSYHDPRTLADLMGLLADLDDAKLLAGGQSLMPMLNMRLLQPRIIHACIEIVQVPFGQVAELLGLRSGCGFGHGSRLLELREGVI